MVTQVSMGELGAVAAREVSRFARNSREWQQSGGSVPCRGYRSDRPRDHMTQDKIMIGLMLALKDKLRSPPRVIRIAR